MSTGQPTCLLFCVHNVSWLLTETREDQQVDDSLTPSDIKTSVSELTDSSNNKSDRKESKNKKAAKVWTVSIEENSVFFYLAKKKKKRC